MNRVELENRLLHEFKYLSVETLEKMLDFIAFLRNDAHIQQSVKPLLEKLATPRQINKAKSLPELLLRGPTLTTEECQLFEENRQWMELWDKF